MMQGWRCSALLTKYSKPPPPPTHPLGQVAGVSAQCGRQSFWWGVHMEQNYPSASSPHVSQMAVLSLLLLLLLLLLFFPPTRKLCVVCWRSTCMLMGSARGFVSIFFDWFRSFQFKIRLITERLAAVSIAVSFYHRLNCGRETSGGISLILYYNCSFSEEAQLHCLSSGFWLASVSLCSEIISYLVFF